MEKPHSLAGRVIKKFGKVINNDYSVVDKFFADMNDFLHLLNSVPFSAIEELEKYDLNRGIMVNIIRQIYKICDAAKIDLVKEIKGQEENPFDGLEEDIEFKKQLAMKISG